MPGAGSNRINEFGFYTNYYTLPVSVAIAMVSSQNDDYQEICKLSNDAIEAISKTSDRDKVRQIFLNFKDSVSKKK